MFFEDRIRERIGDLSSGQKRTAVYLSEHKKEASYNTLAKLSVKIGMSETTIIRTAISLGFDSFSDMQKKMQEEVLGTTVYEEVQAESIYRTIINREIIGLAELSSELSEERIESAAEYLWQSNQVLVTGARGSWSVAVGFANLLEHLRCNVYALQINTEESIGRILDLTKDSVILSVSLSRYSKAGVEALQKAKQRGAHIILVTDSPVSPAATVADDIFVVRTFKNELGFNSYLAVLCVENMLIASIYKNHTKELAERIKYYEEVYKTDNILYE